VVSAQTFEIRPKITHLFGPKRTVDEKRTEPGRSDLRAKNRVATRENGVHHPVPEKPPAERPLDIVRCEPRYYVGRELSVSGFVREIHTQRPTSRFATPGTLGYNTYRKLIGADTYSQVTVIDSDLVSYTVFVPLAQVDLPPGSVVTMQIRSVKSPGEHLFVCRSLDEIEFTRLL